jgi:hypothetical protein
MNRQNHDGLVGVPAPLQPNYYYSQNVHHPLQRMVVEVQAQIHTLCPWTVPSHFFFATSFWLNL